MVRKERGREASKWLMDITRDQNLENIGESSNTSLGGLRRWFAGRIIQPIMHMLWYDPATGEAVQGPPSPSIGDARSIVTETQVTNDVAAGTLTVPAGYAYRVLSASIRNSTRGCTPQLVYAPNGGDEVTVYRTSIPGSTAGPNGAIGGRILRGTTQISPFETYIWGQAGDTFVLTDTAFQALDTTAIEFIFESFNVGTVTT